MAKRVKAIDVAKEKLELLLSNPLLVMESKGWTRAEYDKEVDLLQKKIELSKRGKSSRAKGGNYERAIAKKFKDKLDVELKRTPMSGGFAKSAEKADDYRGDIVALDNSIDFKLHLECKSHKDWAIPSWIRQAEEDCPKGKIPLVVFHRAQKNKDGKRVQEAGDFVILPYNEFCNIVKFDNITAKNISKTKIDEEEIWKPIIGYEHDYMISSYGNIKSLKNGMEKLMKPSVGSSGYLNTALTINGKCKSVRVHKLVALHFCKGYKEGLVVNHKDGDKLNNFYKNLEFATYSDNNSHAYKTGLKKKGEDYFLSVLTNRQVLDIRVSLGFNRMSRKELAQKYSVSETTILRINNDIDYRNLVNLSILCKDHSTWSLPAWIRQVEEDCPKGKIPAVVFHRRQKNEDGKRIQEVGDFITLPLELFLDIVDRDKVIVPKHIKTKKKLKK